MEMNPAQHVVGELLAKCRADHDRWINGDVSAYALPEHATLMPALGGVGRSGPFLGYLQLLSLGVWEAGSGNVELIDGGVSGEIAWLIMVEHAQVKFAGRDEPAQWKLRVTELFRYRDAGWERFHRHADPLVEGHTLDEALRLLR
jgi:hypothetical protein